MTWGIHLVAGGIAGVALLIGINRAIPSTMVVDPPRESAANTRRALFILGFEPSRLAAAGASIAEVDAIVAQTRERSTEILQERHLDSTQQRHRSATTSLSDRQRTRTARNAELAALKASVLIVATPQTRTAMAAIDTNRGRGLPLAHQSTPHSRAEAARLRDAVIKQRTAQRLGKSEPADAGLVLRNAAGLVPAEREVETLPERTNSVRAAWNAAIGQ